jgi:cobalt-zinc-cadmium efflux system membrane fusion protein
MKRHLLNHLGVALFVFAALSGLFLWMTGALHFGAPKAPASAHAEDDGHGHAAGATCAEAPAKPPAPCADGCGDAARTATDLTALEAKMCEHKIRQLDCNECRFELGVVKVQPSVAKALLASVRVEERPVGRALRLTGQVAMDAARVADVTSPGSGKVVRLFKALGDRVAEGDLLAVVRSGAFGEAKAAYIEAGARFQVAKRTLEREKGLFEKKISGEADYLDAQKEHIAAEAAWAVAEKRLHLFGMDEKQIAQINPARDNGAFADLPIRAPRAGQIVAMALTEGKAVEAAQSLLTIADLSQVWVWADLHEQDLAAVHALLAAGNPAPAVVRVGAFPDDAFPGAIDLLANALDEHTRTLKARLRVSNASAKLRPGMFATVDATLASGEKALLAPRDAVLSDEGRSFVFEYWKDDLWVRRDITPGRPLGAFVEVLDGLKPGALVACKGAFMLKSEALRGKMGAGCAD